MTVTVANVVPSTDTFDVWLTKTNEMAEHFREIVITANTDANGSLTTGNAHVNGIFSSLNIAVDTTLRGGNVQTTKVLPISSNVSITETEQLSIGNTTVNVVANSTAIKLANSTASLIMNKPTAAQIAADSYYLNANGSYVELFAGETGNTTTTGTSAQLIDSWDSSTYLSCDYTLTVDDQSANNRAFSKVLVIHDDGDAYMTEYGVVATNTDVGVFSANLDSTTVRLYFAPVSSSTKVYLRKELTIA